MKIGKEKVTQERTAKLLGINFDENQKWSSQIYGKGGMIPSLNSRLFKIKRLKNHLNNKSLLKIVDGLFTSKLRYGLQLLGKVRTCQTDPTSKEFGDIQVIQNKMMRFLEGKKSVTKSASIHC